MDQVEMGWKIPALVEGLKTASQWCPYRPTAKQLMFMLSPVESCLYGGAAYGGKTIAQILAALQGVDHPYYAALILRSSISEMRVPGSTMAAMEMVADAANWRGRGVRWNGDTYSWTWPNGAVIQFGYTGGGAHTRYLGAELDYVGIDESVRCTPQAIQEVSSRINRSKLAVQHIFPSRVRLTSNPGEPRLAASNDYHINEYIRQGPSRYIESRLDDNPYATDTYEETLANAFGRDSERYKQQRNGIWIFGHIEGATWGTDDIVYRTIYPDTPRPADKPYEEYPEELYIEDIRDFVVGVDPSQSGTNTSDEAGIVLAARIIRDNSLHIVKDFSGVMAPTKWQSLVSTLSEDHGRCKVFVEGNLRAAIYSLAYDDKTRLRSVSVKNVSGTKRARHMALRIPCAQGKITFDTSLADGKLIRQMLTWIPSETGGRTAAGSPDRIDALYMAAKSVFSKTI